MLVVEVSRSHPLDDPLAVVRPEVDYTRVPERLDGRRSDGIPQRPARSYPRGRPSRQVEAEGSPFLYGQIFRHRCSVG